ncbi:MAG TPA: altronate dehydratase [Planctomycetota bacterium]|nr:altronate dehydratase [Planctomycetota bacterium]
MAETLKLEQAAVVVDATSDNVAVAKQDLPAGLQLQSAGQRLRLTGPVRRAFRFALKDIPSGVPVLQYGWPIGVSKGIAAGDPVLPTNLENRRVEFNAGSTGSAKLYPPDIGGLPTTFNGFLRPDGRAGIRNWILIAPNSMCASHEAQQISMRAEMSLWSREKYPSVDGVTAIPHDKGCGCTDGSNVDLVLHTIAQYVNHPNVGAAVILELGCEKTNLNAMERYIGRPLDQWGKPVVVLSVQKLGGTEPTIKAGLEAVERLLPEAARALRSNVSVSKLSIGLKCGGSDAFSGVTANPSLGHASDILVAQGGTSMITEVPEMAGCEEKLRRQAVSPAVATEITDAIKWYDDYTARYGHTAFENPSPGNKDGGLINILVKSLGAVAKAGHAPIQGVTPYAVAPKHSGMWIMQGPSYDQLSTPALMAAGAQMVLFTTGRGTTIGNAIGPVIKIASNSETFNRMRGDIDVDAGTILEGTESIEEVGRRIYREIIDVASGRACKAERNHHREFQIWAEQGVAL